MPIQYIEAVTKTYPLEELELIYETQKDLYSEEMLIIEKRFKDLCSEENEKSEKYYTGEYNENSDGNTFEYVVSFLVQLVGYILGSILLSKDNEQEKSVGKACILWGIISPILLFLLCIIVFSIIS